MKIWGITHRGAVREQNQDAFAYQILPDGRAVLVVCDGMGGAKAGNIASDMAVNLFMQEFLSPAEEETDRQRLERAAGQANHHVFLRSNADADCAGMGTTMVVALVGEGKALVLNEGDSRAYHISENGIKRITRDHSLVEDLVERGELTRDQAKNHPHKNLITRALGAEAALHADYFEQGMQDGDFLLLCSDGLSNVVSEQEMLYEVIHGDEAEDCCARLLNIALQRGAPDNVTVALARYEC